MTTQTTRRFSEVCTLTKGRKPNLYSEKPTGGLPYLTARFMRGSEAPQWVKPSDAAAVVAQKTDVIIICDGSNSGEVFSGFSGVVSSTMAIVSHTRTISNDYLRYFLISQVEKYAETKTGAAIPHLDLKGLRDSEVPLPMLDEQQRIVAFLDDAFAGIAKATVNAERNIENADDLYAGTLARLFDQPDMNRRRFHELVDAGIMERPIDGNHGDIHPKKADFVPSGVPFIMASDLVDGCVDQLNCSFITARQAKSLRKGFAKHNDVLLSHKGTIGRVAFLKTAHPFVVLTPQVTYFRVRDETRLSPRYLYFALQDPVFQTELAQIAGAGSTRAYIGILRQLELSIRVPQPHVQAAIVQAADAALDARLRLRPMYEAKLAALSELRASLLHRAFTGQLTNASAVAA